MFKRAIVNTILLSVVLCFTACPPSNPKVVIATDLGNITLELDSKHAPISTHNFVQYIKENRWEGATFYRTVRLDNQPNKAAEVKIEVIQGGLNPDGKHPNYLPPIPIETTKETGILHKEGVISMARDEPNSATAEFFICINEQPQLDFGGKRNPDGQGFAAFGRVVKGMEVVRKIQAQKDNTQMLVQPIKIKSVRLLN